VDEGADEASKEGLYIKLEIRGDLVPSINPDKNWTGVSRELSYARLAGLLGVCGDKNRQSKCHEMQLWTERVLIP